MNALSTFDYVMLGIALLVVVALAVIVVGLTFYLCLFIVRALRDEMKWDPSACLSKGGQNETYQIERRPPPPAPMRRSL